MSQQYLKEAGHYIRTNWKRTPRQLATIIAAALVALAARSSLADHYLVPSGSMLPTIHTGDRILVDKLAYGLRIPFTHTFLAETTNPRSGDVVVLMSPDGTTVLLKRVIAEPGDTVAIREGRIWLNGHPLAVEESPRGLIEVMAGKVHPVRITHGGGPDYGPLTLPAGRYLVVGDNRGDSRDGRIFGLVERNAIFGRALACFYRDDQFGWHPL